MRGRSGRGFARSSLCMWLAVILVTPLLGCEEITDLRILLPGYDSTEIQGIWLWRLDPDSGQYVRDTEIALGEIIEQQGVEYRRMLVSPVDSNETFELGTPVVRYPALPDAVELTLHYWAWGQHSSYRASTYNEHGESVLSASIDVTELQATAGI